MLDSITFKDKNKESTVEDQRILSDADINEIKTVVNNVVTHINTTDNKISKVTSGHIDEILLATNDGQAKLSDKKLGGALLSGTATPMQGYSNDLQKQLEFEHPMVAYVNTVQWDETLNQIQISFDGDDVSHPYGFFDQLHILFTKVDGKFYGQQYDADITIGGWDDSENILFLHTYTGNTYTVVKSKLSTTKTYNQWLDVFEIYIKDDMTSIQYKCTVKKNKGKVIYTSSLIATQLAVANYVEPLSSAIDILNADYTVTGSVDYKIAQAKFDPASLSGVTNNINYISGVLSGYTNIASVSTSINNLDVNKINKIYNAVSGNVSLWNNSGQIYDSGKVLGSTIFNPTVQAETYSISSETYGELLYFFGDVTNDWKQQILSDQTFAPVLQAHPNWALYKLEFITQPNTKGYHVYMHSYPVMALFDLDTGDLICGFDGFNYNSSYNNIWRCDGGDDVSTIVLCLNNEPTYEGLVQSSLPHNLNFTTCNIRFGTEYIIPFVRTPGAVTYKDTIVATQQAVVTYTGTTITAIDDSLSGLKAEVDRILQSLDI